ncbi:MAG: hypothetical protein JXM74_10100, partial [Fusobacteriaceae bacterium]|nr:hypothetical protein [Fusobacteriaceae bacterium]
MEKKKINYNLPIEFSKNLEKVSSNLSKCRARICYGDKNRNYTCFQDVLPQMEKSLIYTPIKAIWSDEKRDFEGHGWTSTEGRIYGIVPADQTIAYEENSDEDGTIKKYMACDVYLYTGLYAEAGYIAGKGLSLELNPKTAKGEWIEDENGNEYFKFSQAEFQALQVLGNDVEPCFGGAAFYEFLMTQKKEDKDKMEIKKIAENLYELTEGEVKTLLYTVTKGEADKLGTATVSSVYEQVDELQAKYSVIETEKTEIETKYSSLETEKTEIETKFSALETEKTVLDEKYSILETEKVEIENKYSTLQVEKVEIETKFSALEAERLEKETLEKNSLIEKYSKIIGEEKAVELEDIKSKVTQYSVQEIEKELAFLYTKSNEGVLFEGQRIYS